MIPRYGRPPNNGQRYIRRPGVYAILPTENSLLLTCQLLPKADVQLPGGGIDPGESPLQALHREVFEETGWHIARPRRLGAYRRFTFMPEYDLWAEKLCTIYIAHPVRRHGRPTEPDHETVMVPAAEAASILGSEGDAAFVNQALLQGLVR